MRARSDLDQLQRNRVGDKGAPYSVSCARKQFIDVFRGTRKISSFLTSCYQLKHSSAERFVVSTSQTTGKVIDNYLTVQFPLFNNPRSQGTAERETQR